MQCECAAASLSECCSKGGHECCCMHSDIQPPGACYSFSEALQDELAVTSARSFSESMQEEPAVASARNLRLQDEPAVATVLVV